MENEKPFFFERLNGNRKKFQNLDEFFPEVKGEIGRNFLRLLGEKLTYEQMPDVFVAESLLIAHEVSESEAIRQRGEDKEIVYYFCASLIPLAASAVFPKEFADAVEKFLKSWYSYVKYEKSPLHQ